jgi:hypothetical protein
MKLISSKSKRHMAVYALTSGGTDLYSATTRVSAASMRATNPDVSIIVVCDRQSYVTMTRSRERLLDEVDDLVVCNTPAGDSGFRSRFVKTQVQHLIDGPFLYLDNDTFVRDDISELFALGGDIACAPNHSRDSIEQQIWSGDEAILLRMGWRRRQDVYVNSGVIFFNCTRGAARVGENWHQMWLRSYAITGNHQDQPALNAAIFDSAPQLEVLPHRFNAQFKMTPSSVSGAALLHFYSSLADDEPVTEVERLALDLLKGADLRRSAIASILRRSHPWRRSTWIDDLAGRRLIKKGSFDCGDQLWFQGHRLRSLIMRIRNHLIR